MIKVHRPGTVTDTFIPVLRRQRQENLSESETNLVYTVSSKRARAI